ncbi:MAG: S41 family peptidase [Clostridia bacterium]|nr:S41 family peptidase [Clostridia bacterium]
MATGTLSTSNATGVEGGEIKWSAVKNKLDVLQRAIELYYKDEVDNEALVEGIYAGYVNGLGDPYSVYYTKEEFDDLMESSSGTYVGIGAYLNENPDTGRVYIVKPMPGSPAEEVGLQADDIIVSIDGEDTTGMDSAAVASTVKGPEGTKVTLGIARQNEKEILAFELERRTIEAPTVSHEMKDDKTGYIAISEFDDVTTSQFEEALSDLKEQGMESMILDLRDNPGGNLNVVVDIAGNFATDDLIVYTEDKNGKKREYRSEVKKSVDIPVIVLVNGNSASAAEILAGCIKDYDTGKLLGTTTFGKGIVQQVLPLDDSSAVKLTVSKYFTPKGGDIHGIGIKPDIELEFDADAYLKDKTDNQLNQAMELLNQ